MAREFKRTRTRRVELKRPESKKKEGKERRGGLAPFAAGELGKRTFGFRQEVLLAREIFLGQVLFGGLCGVEFARCDWHGIFPD